MAHPPDSLPIVPTGPEGSLARAVDSLQYLLRPINDLDDHSAVLDWLSTYKDRSDATYRSYETEVKRFRFFLAHQHPNEPTQFLLRHATHDDIKSYEAALMGVEDSSIQPGLCVIESGRRTGFFARALKPSSVNLALAILHSMYEHFRQPDSITQKPYLLANPVRRVRRATSRSLKQTTRNVQPQAISAMAMVLEARIAALQTHLPADPVALQMAIRSRWVLQLLFGMWLRRAEAASLKMNSFKWGPSGWILIFVRKGRKDGRLPVPDWVMDGLRTYRLTLGLPDLPDEEDSSPAIWPIQNKGKRSKGQNLSEDTIYDIVRDIAKMTADALNRNEFTAEMNSHLLEKIIKELDSFSPHWFRHTGASMAINSKCVTVENASKMLGHSNTAVTTSMYYHPDEDALRKGLGNLGQSFIISPTQDHTK